ncbi:hypothetical protein PAPYR_4780 [Paratrimastix pyriformis]|uniref:Uncharacterized protein n=1 Tax=Paratrimastix pyriformis TaxID=342808 RepID=A0ABQ8ULD0_9EUKA|nr:hypothetical protein PAPYR_4780 [Paratrimastix pyriformis]
MPDRSRFCAFLLWSLCLPVAVSVTLVLITLRLDMGSVHTAFIATPTLFWWVPLLIATGFGVRKWHRRLAAALRILRAAPHDLLTSRDLASVSSSPGDDDLLLEVERNLISSYNNRIYLVHDDPYSVPGLRNLQLGESGPPRPNRVVLALFYGTLRTFPVLWDGNDLWQQAYEEDFGDVAAQLVEVDGPQSSAKIPWRKKYQEHIDFLHSVHRERKRLFCERLKTARRVSGPSRDDYFNWVAWTVMSPLMTSVAIPLFLLFLILRAESAVTWSLHVIFAPADYMLFCGLCLFGKLALQFDDVPALGRLLYWLITAIFPVGIATLHWAAARIDWIAASGGAEIPTGFHWLYIFAPGMALALVLSVVVFCLLSQFSGFFESVGGGYNPGVVICGYNPGGVYCPSSAGFSSLWEVDITRVWSYADITRVWSYADITRVWSYADITRVWSYADISRVVFCLLSQFSGFFESVGGGYNPGVVICGYIPGGLLPAVPVQRVFRFVFSSWGNSRCVAFLGGVTVPHLVLAFLVLLGYKLQWGNPGFSYANVFIPLWLFALGAECMVLFVFPPCDRWKFLQFLLWSLCLPVAVTVTLVLIVLRLDRGTVHTAFIAIPTLFWWLPLVVVSTRFARKNQRQLVRFLQMGRAAPHALLGPRDLHLIEQDLLSTFGSDIYPAHGDPYQAPYRRSAPETRRVIEELAA